MTVVGVERDIIGCVLKIKMRCVKPGQRSIDIFLPVGGNGNSQELLLPGMPSKCSQRGADCPENLL